MSLRRCRAVQRTENQVLGFQRTAVREDRRQMSLRRCRAGGDGKTECSGSALN
ncbi:MAG: hypothetical protein LBD06_12230 [Candidatus Accumulibacter sp.]|nr:hypothetical protein [Accumulibacter sp.]